MLGAYYDTNVNSTEYVFIETAVSLRSHAVCVWEKRKKKWPTKRSLNESFQPWQQTETQNILLSRRSGSSITHL